MRLTYLHVFIGELLPLEGGERARFLSFYPVTDV